MQTSKTIISTISNYKRIRTLIGSYSWKRAIHYSVNCKDYWWSLNLYLSEDVNFMPSKKIKYKITFDQITLNIYLIEPILDDTAASTGCCGIKLKKSALDHHIDHIEKDQKLNPIRNIPYTYRTIKKY